MACAKIDVESNVADNKNATGELAGDAVLEAKLTSQPKICADSEDLCSKIVKQVEFYFSDANILKDSYLMSKLKASQGWVLLSVVASFKRMKALTDSLDDIVLALRLSEKLELSEDETKIRRVDPLPNWDPTVYRRSLVISGQSEDLKLTSSTLKSLFVENNFPPLIIRGLLPNRPLPCDLRKSVTRHPCLGVEKCFVVEFETQNICDQALKLVKATWPTLQVHVLSKPSVKQKTSTNNASGGKESAAPEPFRHLDDADRPRIRLVSSQPSGPTVVLIREPIGPPSEESQGFPPGWREELHGRLAPKEAALDIPIVDPAIVRIL